MIVDPLHHLGGYVVGSARGDEGLLEPTVAPDLLQSARTVPGPIHHRDPASVVGHTGRHHDHRHEDPDGVDYPEGLPPRDLLTGVVSPGGAGDRRRTSDAASVDDPGRGFSSTPFLLADMLGQTMADLLPCAVLRPFGVVPVDGVPVGVAVRERTPLTPGRRHEEDGVHDVPLGPLGRTADPALSGVDGDQIGDQFPLLIGHITVHGPPGLRNGLIRSSHRESI